MKRLSYILSLLFLALCWHSSFAQKQSEKLSTIVELLKYGKNGDAYVVQGEIMQIRNTSHININDGTYNLDVYLKEELQNLGLRPGDAIVVKGIVQSQFLRGNILAATAIQRIDALLPRKTQVTERKPAGQPDKISSDPNAVTPILDVLQFAAHDQFVNVAGNIERFVQPGKLLLLQDQTGKIAVQLQPGHAQLNLKANDPLKLRARVLVSQTGGKTLFAVFIDGQEALDPGAFPEPPLPKVTAPPPAPKKEKPSDVIVTKPIFISGPGPTSEKPAVEKKAPAAQPKAASKPAPAEQKTPPPAKPQKDPESRLALIKRLHEKGLITQEEYDSKRMEILSEL